MKVLVVDDEKIIVDGIKLLIEESGYRFDAIFTAYNAADAIEVIKTENIDILFTDIKMPVVDGFELITKTRVYAQPEIILISGFAEFEYAQQALNAGVLGYILKPIDEAQFFSVLKKAVNKRLKYNAQKRASAHGEKELNDISGHIGQLLNSVFDGQQISSEDAAFLEENLKSSDESEYQLITFHIDIANDLDADLSIVMEEVHAYAEPFFKEHIKNVTVFFFESDNGKKLECLCVGKSSMDDTQSVCENFLREFSCCVPVDMYISISDTRKKLTRELYTHSQEAYYEHYVKRSKRVHCYNASSLQLVSGIEKDLNIIDVAICNDDMSGLRKILDKVFSSVYIMQSGLSLRAVYFLVANTVILTFNRLKVEIMAGAVDELLSERSLREMKSISELSEYIYGVVFDVLVQQKQHKGTHMTIMKVINYVDANFDKDLSVKQLSNQFGLTPNYLSQIFKKETGENFAVYLNKLRIKRSCELLKSSNIKIYEIGRLVGYNDSQYFYRVFKKYVNQTPIEYRMNNK